VKILYLDQEKGTNEDTFMFKDHTNC